MSAKSFFLNIGDVCERAYKSFIDSYKKRKEYNEIAHLIRKEWIYLEYLEKARRNIDFSDGLPFGYRDGQIIYHLKKEQEKHFPGSIHGCYSESIRAESEDYKLDWGYAESHIAEFLGIIALSVYWFHEKPWISWMICTIIFFLSFIGLNVLIKHILELRHLKIAAECQAEREAIEEEYRKMQERSDRRFRDHLEKELNKTFAS